MGLRRKGIISNVISNLCSRHNTGESKNLPNGRSNKHSYCATGRILSTRNAIVCGNNLGCIDTKLICDNYNYVVIIQKQVGKRKGYSNTVTGILNLTGCCC